MKHAWYQLDDAVVLVFCGTTGIEGIFRIFPGRADPHWEFCPPETTAWDWYHQAAYAGGHRADECDAKEWAQLPPLPQGWPPAAEIVVHDPPEPEAVEARRGGRLWDAVERAGGVLEVFVVLYEDRYESIFGDGNFYDFRDAFFAEAAARACVEELQAQYSRGHLRRGCLRAGGERLTLDIPHAERSPFDHLTLAEVCAALTARLDNSATPAGHDSI
jgi:hypothetical protein